MAPHVLEPDRIELHVCAALHTATGRVEGVGISFRGSILGTGADTGDRSAGNAPRGYDIGTRANARGARVVSGGIHATLFPDEAHQLGGAHAVVRGDPEM
jgi:hypothetical protein